MNFSPGAFVAGLAVGLVVGLTGSGGGALLAPILILALGVNAKSAVASDLVASVFMRPVAGFIHLRRSIVHWPIVGWLVLGSTPTAFVAGLVSTKIVPAARSDALLEPVIGGILLFTGAAAVARRFASARHHRSAPHAGERHEVRVRPLLTVAIGAAGGLAVGVTSVGSGTLMLVGLALIYPALSAYELVGTDLVQAVPLVLAAAAGHLVGGGLHMTLTAAVVAGGIPGAAIGASVAKYVPPAALGVIVAGVIFASGCALIGWVPGTIVGGVAVVACAVGVVGLSRKRHDAGASDEPPGASVRTVAAGERAG